MDRVENLYQWLARGPSPECDRILAAAAEHAEPPWFERIVEELLARRTDEAWAGLIGCYGRLSPELRVRLTADAELMRAGMSRALGAPSSEARRSALEALAAQPSPRLAYLLPDALRAPADDIRRAAARTLREMAAAMVDQVPSREWDEARRTTYAQARAEVARAAYEALRCFDLHFRAEAVEVALWFARDLGAPLWDILGNRRSQCSAVVGANLPAWDGPRLAGFLLAALGVPEWRMTARQTLRAWSTTAQAVALLRHSDLLADREFRRRLAAVREPALFTELRGLRLKNLPPELAVYAPQWACCLGLSTPQKIRFLVGWLEIDDLAIQRACLVALVGLGVPEAAARVKALAAGDSPLARVARECQTQAAQGGGASPVPSPVADCPGAAAATTSAPIAHSETLAWSACRDQVLREDAALIARVRENLADWRPTLAEYLRSTDPRERLLGLRVIAGAGCARELGGLLDPLLDDPVDAIRELATKVATPAAASPPTARSHPSTRAADSLTRVAAVRSDLQRALAELLTDDCDPRLAIEIHEQVRALLRELAPERSSSAPGAHGSEGPS